MKKKWTGIVAIALSVMLFLAGCTAPGNSGQQKTTSTQSNAQMTEEDAKAIALEDAGVAEADTVYMRVRSDRDDGQACYDVEFATTETKYDYTINAQNGEVIGYETETMPNALADGTVTSEEAQQMALERVPGATRDNLVEFENEGDDQDYEGKIIYNGIEYEFEINKNTGNFDKWEEESEHH